METTSPGSCDTMEQDVALVRIFTERGARVSNAQNCCAEMSIACRSAAWLPTWYSGSTEQLCSFGQRAQVVSQSLPSKAASGKDRTGPSRGHVDEVCYSTATRMFESMSQMFWFYFIEFLLQIGAPVSMRPSLTLINSLSFAPRF